MDTKVSLYHSRKAGTPRESWTQKPPLCQTQAGSVKIRSCRPTGSHLVPVWGQGQKAVGKGVAEGRGLSSFPL